MPRDGSGVYTLPPGYEAVTGEIIQASQHNPPLEDLAAAMTQSIARTGVTAVTANIPFNGFKLINIGDATNDTDALNRQTADARYVQQTSGGWTPVSQETLSANATQFTDIVVDGAKLLRVTVVIIPAVGIGDAGLTFRVSTDGINFPSGASDYITQLDQGEASAATAVAFASDAAYLIPTYKNGTSGWPLIANVEFFPGGTTTRAGAKSDFGGFGTSGNTMTGDLFSARDAVGAVTHLRILATVANGIGSGSFVQVEALS